MSSRVTGVSASAGLTAVMVCICSRASSKYILGDNRVVECEGRRNFVLSEYEEYRIKCLVHFYDFIQEEHVAELNEIKKFGMPPNYKYKDFDLITFLKSPDIKIILQEN